MSRTFLVALLTSVSVARAVELHHVEVRTGTDGLEAAPLTIANVGQEAVSCNADFAHWYSGVVAIAAPGASAQLDLWFDPQTGTYSLLNEKRENLPVERLWCGLAGREYETRAQIALDRGPDAHEARAVACGSADGKLVCR